MLKTKIKVLLKAWYLGMGGGNPKELVEVVASLCPRGHGSHGEGDG